MSQTIEYIYFLFIIKQTPFDTSCFYCRYERLYNSVAKILLTEKEDEAPILLAKGGGISGKERYKALEIGIGEGKTFMKSTVNGEQIGPKIKLNVKESFKDLEDAVDKVLDMIIAAFEVDLKKGVDL